MHPELSLLLDYTNTPVITRFCSDHPEISLDEGQLLFQDLLAWMWLKQQRNKENKPTYLFGPLLILDDLWHTFILHTRDYIDFSMNFFGEYLHHEVEPVGFEHVLNEDELADYLQDCFKYLNEEWVKRRFAVALVATELTDSHLLV